MDETNSLIEQQRAKLAARRAKRVELFKDKLSPVEPSTQARANDAEGCGVALAGGIAAPCGRLEHDRSPAGVMGIGIDRLCRMLLGQDSLRDVIQFPQLKPK